MWKSRRRAVLLLGGAATLLIPFLEIRGRSAVRFDLPTLSLHFLGAVVPIDEFHLVLLGTLFLVALILGVTGVLGRWWCGWICPQTVIGEAGEWIASALPRRFRAAGKTAVLLPFAALVSLSLLWYFVPPVEATRNLFRSPVLLGFFLAQWGAIYAMVAIVGTRFCRTVCPYAMLQNVLADRETLSVAYDPARPECLRCDRCTLVCPVGIDIRKGAQRECIACAGGVVAARHGTVHRLPGNGPARENVPARRDLRRGRARLPRRPLEPSRSTVRRPVGREPGAEGGKHLPVLRAARFGPAGHRIAVRGGPGAPPRRSGDRRSLPGARHGEGHREGWGQDAG